MLYYTARTHFKRFVVVILAVSTGLALGGCSRMRFADQQVETIENDPKEDIVLFGVTTDVTSGSAVTSRISAKNAVFTASRKYLNLAGIGITMIKDNGQIEGQTQADVGTIYLADDPRAGRTKNDLELTGTVRHQVPKATDPEKTAAVLTTNAVLWDNLAQRFFGRENFELSMMQPSGKPIVSHGDGFVVTRDLKRWLVSHGSIAGGETGDPRARAAETRKKLLEAAADEPGT